MLSFRTTTSTPIIMVTVRSPKNRRRQLHRKKPTTYYNFCIAQFLLFLFIPDTSWGQIHNFGGASAAADILREERVTFTVDENVPTDTLVGVVKLLPGFSYTLNEPNPWVQFDSVSGKIRTATAGGKLDREILPSSTLRLIIVARGSPATYFITVEITVLDQNDNTPRFPWPIQNISIPESTRLGSHLALNSASDIDEGLNGQIVAYEIRGGNERDTFELVTDDRYQNGGGAAAVKLALKKPFDRETKSQYMLNISAQDSGSPPRFGYLKVLINVIDSNDNAPVFNQSHYEINVPESLTSGSHLLTVSALDADLGLNSKLVYIIKSTDDGTPSSPVRQFTLDSVTGELTTRVDRLTCPSICNSPMSTSSGGGSPSALLLVNHDTNCTRQCIFTVEAVDHGTPAQRGRAFVKVSVVDENDHTPRILFRTYPQGSSVASVEESSAVGSVVAVVTTVDEDLGANGETDVDVTGGNDDGYFQLDVNGVFSLIRLARPLLQNNQTTSSLSSWKTTSPFTPSFNLSITARDRGTPSRSSVSFLPIFIRNQNDLNRLTAAGGLGGRQPGTGQQVQDKTPMGPLEFTQSSYSVSLPTSRVPSGTYVLDLKAGRRLGRDATDPIRPIDSGLEYSILAQNGENDPIGDGYFKLNPTTGLLTTTEKLNDLPPTTLVLKVKVIDPNGVRLADSTDSTEVRVKIESSSLLTVLPGSTDDKATVGIEFDQSEYVVKLAEDAAIGTELVRIQAGTGSLAGSGLFRSSEPNIRYAWDPFEEYSELFSLDASSGLIRLKRELDVESLSSTTMNLTVLAFVGAVVNGQSGQAAAVSSTNLLVTIQDVNDNSPKFYPTTYYAHATPYSTGEIVTVTAHDLDPFFSTLTYKWGGESQEAQAGGGNGRKPPEFTLNEQTGEISRTQGSILAADQNYTLEIHAMDNGGRQSENFAIVHVFVRSDAELTKFAPTFTAKSYRFVVDEDGYDAEGSVADTAGLTLGRSVGTVSAMDSDLAASPVQITYSISSGDPDSLFTIGQYSGEIRTVGVIDREQTDQFTLEITALSNQGGIGRTLVNIDVHDVNDNQPKFLSSKIAAAEKGGGAAFVTVDLERSSAAAGSTVFYATATDPDLGENGALDYQLIPPIPTGFALNEDTGLLYLSRPAYALPDDVYKIQIRVTDQAPQFPKSAYLALEVRMVPPISASPNQSTVALITLYVTENTPVNTRLQQLESDNVALYSPETANDHQSTFSVFPDGWIFVQNPVDYEREKWSSLNVIVRRRTSIFIDAAGQSKLMEAKTLIRVQFYIIDTNDNVPKCSVPDPIQYRIDEHSRPYSPLGFIPGEDPDSGLYGRIQYRLLNQRDLLSVNEHTGELKALPSWDREEFVRGGDHNNNLIRAVVELKDFGQPRRLVGQCHLEFEIVDVNDHLPVFTLDLYSGRVEENTVPESEILQVTATDQDSGANGEISYEIVDGSVENRLTRRKFRLEPTTGRLFIRSPLDREEQSRYRLVIRASDAGSPPKSSEAVAIIDVDDANDNPPRFVDFPRNGLNVSENTPIGTELVRLTAVDPDSSSGIGPTGTGNRGGVTYSLTAGNLGGTFRLDSQSGQLFLMKRLDFEAISGYALTIIASDESPNSPQQPNQQQTKLPLVINVMDYNDNPPVIRSESLMGQIEENAPIGAEVMRVQADDADLRPIIHYSILSQLPYPAFEIDEVTGVIRTLDTLDRELTENFQLRIRAANPPSSTSLTSGDIFQKSTTTIGSLFTEQTIRIQVLDTNDNAPVFVGPHAAVVEKEAPAGYKIASIHAEDSDGGAGGGLNASVGYNLAEPKDSENWRLFGLNLEGELYLKESLGTYAAAVDTRSTYHLNIQAMDRVDFRTKKLLPGSLSSRIQFTVVVIGSPGHRTNTALQFSQQTYDFSTSEQAHLGADLGSVYASGLEPPEFVRYYLTKITTIQTTSTGGRQHHPINQQRERRTLDCPFTVNSETGQIRVSKTVDREALADSVALEIVAVQIGGEENEYSASCQVRISIDDSNDEKPVPSSEEYQFEVSEATEIGEIIGEIRATDPDTKGQLKYGFAHELKSSGSTQNLWMGERVENNPFHIDERSGIVSLQSALDHETQPMEYQLEVDATDGLHSVSVPLFIKIMDANDNAPVFSAPSYTFSVSESAGSLTVVGVVRAEDPDGTEFSYSFVQRSSASGDPSTAVEQSPFTVDSVTGIIFVANREQHQSKHQLLDHEKTWLYKLTVEARDWNNLSSTTDVIIIVQDANDNPPEFPAAGLLTDVIISENIGIPSEPILNLTVTDRDSESMVTFAIVGGDPWQQFELMENGSLILVKPVDRERQLRHQLTVSAYDGKYTVTTLVNVRIADVNDNSPRLLNNPTVSIVDWSTAKPGDVIAQLRAEDGDEGLAGQIEYHLHPRHADLFSVDPVLGWLRVKESTNHRRRPSQRRYNLSVTLSDRGRPQLSTEAFYMVELLESLDADLAPVFTHPKMELSLAEDSPIGKSLIQISMRGGVPESRQLSITDGDRNGVFTLTQDTGILSLNQPLDFEEIQEFNIRVGTGRDPAEHCEIHIKVLDVNDNAPFFAQDPLYFQVAEGLMEASRQNPILIGSARAKDDDSGLNSKLAYSIVQGDSERFGIDSMNGDLLLFAPLDREAESEYQLRVHAADSGSPRLHGETSVVIRVRDRNDNRPVFDQPYYTATVREQQKPIRSDQSPTTTVEQPQGNQGRVIIATVTATDPDEGLFGEIRYSLSTATSRHEGGIHGDQIPFAIDPETGEVYVTGAIDREEQSDWSLIVTAKDRDPFIPLQSQTDLNIIVDDINDNKPFFRTSQRQIYVPDNLEDGDLVFIIEGADADTDRLTYALEASDGSGNGDDGSVKGALEINQMNGELRCTSPKLKRMEIFSVVVIISDGVHRRSATFQFFTRPAATFPRFREPTSVSNFLINEDQPDGTEVARVTAESPSKQAPFGRIHYKFAAGNDDSAFTIEQFSGRIRSTKTLNRERRDTYALWIEASDSDSPSLSTLKQIRVDILDTNDNAPRFQSPVYYAELMENQYPPVNVIGLTANDPDSGQNAVIRYRIISGNVDVTNSLADYEGEIGGPPFEINSETGVVSARMMLDREERSEYQLLIGAEDRGTPNSRNSTALLRIRLLDQNDNSPRFTRLFSGRVEEDSAIGTFVTQVTSSDEDTDEHSNNTYFLTQNPDKKFAIDPYSGNVTLVAPLDREERAEYPLQVVAVDGSWRVQTSLIVTVTDVNDNAPRFAQSIYHFNVPENAPPLTKIGQVLASDQDSEGPNSQIEYSFERKSDVFSISGQTGEIFTLRSMRFMPNSLNSHQLRVLARDRGKPVRSSLTVTVITVGRVNNFRPVFPVDEYSAAVTEEAALGATILQVSAFDKDEGENGRIFYRLRAEAAENALLPFEVDEDSGVIRVSENIGGPEGSEYRLTVTATDNGAPQMTTNATVIIFVTGPNLNSPVFTDDLSAFEGAVDETAEIGSAVLQVSAADSDGEDTLSGRISYSLEQGSNPKFEQSNLNGGKWLPFTIDSKSGIISVNASLADSDDEYSFSVVASDTGFPRRTAQSTVSVTVRDVNNHAPEFLQKEIYLTVRENSAEDTIIGNLVADDRDAPPNDRMEFTIIAGNHQGLFALNKNSGTLSVAAPRSHEYGGLDFELSHRYALTVQVNNPGRPEFRSVATVHIDVTSANEHSPVLSQNEYTFDYDIEVAEGVIGRISATDKDGGRHGRIYFLLDQISARKGFVLDSQTGELRRSRTDPLSRVRPIQLEAFALNGANTGSISSAKIQINVRSSSTDGNAVLHQPISFTRELYAAAIPENAPQGQSVLSVAIRQSSASSSTRFFQYRLVNSNQDGSDQIFSLDPRTGLVTVLESPDYERQFEYSFTVEVVELHKGTPSTISPATAITSTKVRISVLDENDNAPQLPMENRIGWVTEGDGIGTNVMILNPVDLDSPASPDSPQKESYEFQLLNDSPLFTVDHQTGILRTKAVLDREQPSGSKQHTLTVEIRDSGNPPQTSQETVTIFVRDVNDMAPTTNEVHLRVLSIFSSGAADDENPPGGEEKGRLGNVHPADRDEFGDYHCRLLRGGTPFVLDQDCTLNYIGYPPARTASGWKEFHETVTKEDPLLLVINGTDGVHGWVQYSVAVQFDKLEDSVIKSSLVQIRLTPLIAAAGNFTETFDQIRARIATDGSSRPLAAELVSFNDSRHHLSNQQPSLFVVLKDQATMGYLSSESASQQLRSKLLRSNSGQILQGVTSIHGDPCASNPCQHDTKCHSRITANNGVRKVIRFGDSSAIASSYPTITMDYACDCGGQYRGRQCENVLNLCQDHPCFNGGTCQVTGRGNNQTGTRVECICPEGWEGDRCEMDRNECNEGSIGDNRKKNGPCLNGGHCENSPGGYNCICLMGFSGFNCQHTVNLCEPNPCENGGDCRIDGETAVCQCAPGYSGSRCSDQSLGFNGDGWVRLPSLNVAGGSNMIRFEFRTRAEYGLLLYSFAGSGNFDDYVGLDIVGRGQLRLSANVRDLGHMNIILERFGAVNDGRWYQASIVQHHQVSSVRITLSVGLCRERSNKQGEECDQCVEGNRTCSITADIRRPELISMGQPVYLGGVKDFNDLLFRPGHLSAPSFTGCIRGFEMNGFQLKSTNVDRGRNVLDYCPATAGNARAGGNRCTAKNYKKICGPLSEDCLEAVGLSNCVCNGGYKASSCNIGETGIHFSGKGFIQYRLKDAYRQKLEYVSVDMDTLYNSDDLFVGSGEGRQTKAQTRRAKRGALLNLYETGSRRSIRRAAPLRPPLPSSTNARQEEGGRPSRNAVTQHWIQLHFRTTEPNGLLFLSASLTRDFSMIDIWNGTIRYLSKFGEGQSPVRVLLDNVPTSVSDGRWHKLDMEIDETATKIELRLDGLGRMARAKYPIHSFLGPNVETISIGGVGRDRSQPSTTNNQRNSAKPDQSAAAAAGQKGGEQVIKVYGQLIPGFEGCIQRFLINNEAQPLGGTLMESDALIGTQIGLSEAVSVGGCNGPKLGCISPPCATSTTEQVPAGPSESLTFVQILIILAGVFILALLIFLCLAFCIRRRLIGSRTTRKRCPSESTTRLSNIAIISQSVMQVQPSAPTMNNRRNEGGNLGTLGSEKSSDGSGIFTGHHAEGAGHHLDLLGSGRHSSELPQPFGPPPPFYSMSHHHYQNPIQLPPYSSNYHKNPTLPRRPNNTTNQQMTAEAEHQPEHYDLDNASSIAPSDIDAAGSHYRSYRSNSSVNREQRRQRRTPGGHQQQQRSITPSLSSVKKLKAALRGEMEGGEMSTSATSVHTGPGGFGSNNNSGGSRPSSAHSGVAAPGQSQRRRGGKKTPATGGSSSTSRSRSRSGRHRRSQSQNRSSPGGSKSPSNSSSHHLKTTRTGGGESRAAYRRYHSNPTFENEDNDGDSSSNTSDSSSSPITQHLSVPPTVPHRHRFPTTTTTTTHAQSTPKTTKNSQHNPSVGILSQSTTHSIHPFNSSSSSGGRHSSSSSSSSSTESVQFTGSDLDLDKLRKPRRILANPAESLGEEDDTTDVDGGSGARGGGDVPQSLAPFRPPRTMFPVSEDDDQDNNKDIIDDNLRPLPPPHSSISIKPPRPKPRLRSSVGTLSSSSSSFPNNSLTAQNEALRIQSSSTTQMMNPSSRRRGGSSAPTFSQTEEQPDLEAYV